MVVVVSGGLTGIGISLRVGMLGVVVAVEVQFRGRESLCCQCKGRGGGVRPAYVHQWIIVEAMTYGLVGDFGQGRFM